MRLLGGKRITGRYIPEWIGPLVCLELNVGLGAGPGRTEEGFWEGGVEGCIPLPQLLS